MTQSLINKYFFFLFVFSLIFTIIFYKLIGFSYTDEICALALLAFFLVVVLKNKDWQFNKAFLVTLFVFCFYTLYSILIGSNSNRAIFNDLIIQIKPYLGFFCVYHIKPVFNKSYKKLLRDISLLVWLLFLLPVGILSTVYPQAFTVAIEHPAYYGIAVSIVGLCYLYATDFTLKNKLVFLLMLSIGVFCGRSKFYGFFALSVFAILFFSNLKSFKLSFKNVALILCTLAAVVFVARDKIILYFGQSLVADSTLEDDMIARFMLYKTFPEVLHDYFPFGSGFATYATHSSGEFYSSLYAKYELDSVWGLSRSYHDFISDTFYPSLAQFGVVGVILFICFWIYIIRKGFKLYKASDYADPKLFLIVLLIVCFIFIECTTGATFIAQGGFFVMMMLGLAFSTMKSELQINENTIEK